MEDREKTKVQLIRELSVLRRRIAQLEAAETAHHGTLPGDVANEFNNILTVILGYAELALYDVPENSVVWQHLHSILAAGKRAMDLMRVVSNV